MSDSKLQPLEQHLFAALSQAKATDQLLVGLSGGKDSKVLLHALVRLRQLGLVSNITAAHVNHGLQAEASHWQKRCEADCQSYQVKLFSTELNLGQIVESNIEAAARTKRYDFFKSLLTKNQWLLLAHHQNDQAETLMFRLLRGCGIDGAGAMPQQRALAHGKLLRPLLAVCRAEIDDYAKQQKLEWIEDPSNQSLDYSRNFIRHQLFPLIQKKWPAYAATLARFAGIAQQQSELLEQIAAEDLANIVTQNQQINLRQLMLLSRSRQMNLLHYWGKTCAEKAPSNKEIEELMRQLPAAGKNAIEVKFASRIARSYAGQLHLCVSMEPVPLAQHVIWDNFGRHLTLANATTIYCHPVNANGLRLPRENEVVTVVGRSGGERCLPDYRDKTSDLKKIFQEQKVPPWQRNWLPVIYFNGEIAAVPGVFVAKAFIAGDGQAGYQLTIS